MKKYSLSFSEFASIARPGCVIPLTLTAMADTETPITAFYKLRQIGPGFLLESVEGSEKTGRYSFIGMNPFMTLRITRRAGKYIATTRDRNGTRMKELPAGSNPLFILRELLNRFEGISYEGLPPFTGGAVGMMSYETYQLFEKIPDIGGIKDLELPVISFIFVDSVVAFDRYLHTVIPVTNIFVEGKENLRRYYDEACFKLDSMLEVLETPFRYSGKETGRLSFKPEMTRNDFRKIVKKAREFILAGDIFQVVLSQRFFSSYEGDPFLLYRTLRGLNPSPYMFYLDFEDFHLIGASPEMFVRLSDGNITIRPIAGTRPRGAGQAEDEKLEKELLSDEKERAEHVMLVDLARNDIGRVSEFGSVKVTDFMRIERYSHVMHMVSNIEGKLKKGLNSIDLVSACFPAGTVSGAPKIRAAEIIASLERAPREFYAGITGYFDWNGNFDSAITIRTVLVKDGRAIIQAGAGIVADSDPDREYDETVNKAKALIEAGDRIKLL